MVRLLFNTLPLLDWMPHNARLSNFLPSTTVSPPIWSLLLVSINMLLVNNTRSLLKVKEAARVISVTDAPSMTPSWLYLASLLFINLILCGNLIPLFITTDGHQILPKQAAILSTRVHLGSPNLHDLPILIYKLLWRPFLVFSSDRALLFALDPWSFSDICIWNLDLMAILGLSDAFLLQSSHLLIDYF